MYTASKVSPRAAVRPVRPVRPLPIRWLPRPPWVLSLAFHRHNYFACEVIIVKSFDHSSK